ncbi:MAG: DinB family protein [Acidimicrobiales bacterium]
MDQPPSDSKDWTWVLERACPECGFDAAVIDRDELAALFRSNAATWRQLLGRGGLVGRRPPVEPGAHARWSGLEYGAHVRDVYELFLERLNSMLTEDDPTFSNWDQDDAAVEGKYIDEEPDRVAYSLALTAGKVADVVDRLNEEQWTRTGHRSDGAAFTVESFLTYLLHDVTHHVVDVEAGYEALTEDE